MATQGIYLGGGIAPKIIEKLQSPAFISALSAKGRMKPLLEAIPVWVILNPAAALLGAARYAALMTADSQQQLCLIVPSPSRGQDARARISGRSPAAAS